MRRSTREKRRGVDAWIKVRARHLRTYPECRICGWVESSNHVHHLCYPNGGRGHGERPGDLVTLCAQHHNAFHDDLGRASVTMERGLAWIDEMRIVEALLD